MMTVQDYFATPETVIPQELIYGAMRVADSPAPIHQEAVGALFVALREHVKRRLLGTVWLAPLDVVLDRERALVIQPDLFVILHGGAAVVTDRVEGPPDLVIEVLSPRPRIGELAERVAWFRDYGVRECWLIHQIERRIEVLQFAGRSIASQHSVESGQAIASVVLPEFNLSPIDVLGY